MYNVVDLFIIVHSLICIARPLQTWKAGWISCHRTEPIWNVSTKKVRGSTSFWFACLTRYTYALQGEGPSGLQELFSPNIVGSTWCVQWSSDSNNGEDFL